MRTNRRSSKVKSRVKRSRVKRSKVKRSRVKRSRVKRSSRVKRVKRKRSSRKKKQYGGTCTVDVPVGKTCGVDLTVDDLLYTVKGVHPDSPASSCVKIGMNLLGVNGHKITGMEWEEYQTKLWPPGMGYATNSFEFGLGPVVQMEPWSLDPKPTELLDQNFAI